MSKYAKSKQFHMIRRRLRELLAEIRLLKNARAERIKIIFNQQEQIREVNELLDKLPLERTNLKAINLINKYKEKYGLLKSKPHEKPLGED